MKSMISFTRVFVLHGGLWGLLAQQRVDEIHR
jgi:hypothetical protein